MSNREQNRTQVARKHSGKLFLWNDTSVYLGTGFEPETHRHHAVQCCIALEGRLKIRGQGDSAWRYCHGAIIGSNVLHSIANPDGPICLLYLEKSSNHYRSILDYHCLKTKCDIRKEPLVLQKIISRPLRKRALKLQSEGFSDDGSGARLLFEANRLKEDCLRLFNAYFDERQSMDHRISELLVYVHQHPGQLFSGEQLASRINLSESRMQHLFKQHLGLPMRRYLLWMRLRSVIEMTVADCSLTQAAYAAGFSDSAHFSRTFKSMFGLSASSLLAARSGLQTTICE